MHPLAIGFGWKSRPHLSSHSVELPLRPCAFSWNDTLCTALLADVPMIAFTIKLGIGQDRGDRQSGHYLIQQWPQGGAIIDWSLMRLLRQDQAPAPIDGKRPSEPISPPRGSTTTPRPPENAHR